MLMGLCLTPRHPSSSSRNSRSPSEMSRELFGKIYHDITDPTTGSQEFQKGMDVAGGVGASAFQKFGYVMREPAYGLSNDKRLCARMVVCRVQGCMCCDRVGQYSIMCPYNVTRAWVQVFIEVFCFATVRMLDVMEFNKHQTQVLEWKW